MKIKLLVVLLLVFAPLFARADNLYTDDGRYIPEVIALEAKARGVDVQLALYITWQESNWNCDAVGDGGTSRGCWQIHLPAHKEISVVQAHDIDWSTSWSMNQLALGNCRIWSTCPLARR